MANRKVYHSDFLVTVNTNFRPTTEDELQDMSNNLEHAMDSMTHAEGLREIVTVLREGESFTAGFVREVHSEVAVEVGGSKYGGRVHAHATIKIAHYSRIRLNPLAIRDYIVRELNSDKVKNVHVDIKLLPTSGYVEDYVKKNVRSKSKTVTF